MPRARPQIDPQFSRRLTVETPEHVHLEFELAGVGSRAAAALYDFAIQAAILVIVSLAVGISNLVPNESTTWAMAVFIFVYFVILWGYFVLFEGLRNGRTPGKKLLGIRVVMETGHPVTFQAAAVRNLLRIADFQPAGVPLLGLLLLFFERHNKRLGDIVAGTIVVRDQAVEATTPASEVTNQSTIETGPPLLTDKEFQLLERYFSRIDSLPAQLQIRFGIDLARRFADRFPERDPQAKVFLTELYDAERMRRTSVSATRKKKGAVRIVAAGERFVTTRQETWHRFNQRAAQLQRSGLTGMSGNEITAFAAEYRAVAADLARARTYGVDQRVVKRLEQIVSAGHNVLYGLRGVRRISLGRMFFRNLPAAVVQARSYVLTAFLLFALSAAVGFLLIRERPSLAAEIMPPVVLARAEAGIDQRAEGRGYAQAPSPYLPVVASSIVANNVQVAFGAFALGITAGIGTLAVLVFNGLFFGSILGVFANYGLAGWLLTFVAGHGILELTAIFVAGGAGLLIGRALIAPGDLARRDALVVHGRLAIRMVGASASLLLLAGIIEGFLSASDAPSALKFTVSAASAVLLILYFKAGREAQREFLRQNEICIPG
ncbi:MAG: stage II sporulation protein M [Gemmatimonadales bacterium]